MLKGDLRKHEILRTAESLFCKNGYAETSVQDILDILHLSKGSFYHHFASKELLLECICKERASGVFQKVCQALPADKTIPSLQRLETLLTGMMPLKGEKISFLLMLLPVFRLPEGWSVKKCYCDALADFFRNTIRDQITACAQEGVLFCEDPDITTDIVMLLINDLWCRICEIILMRESERAETEPSELLHLLEQYRRTIEKILTIPFGSLLLMNLQDIMGLCAQIHQHWKI